MKAEASLQQLLFDKIQEKLRPHQSLVDEISEVLNIGIDGAYRRRRSETPLRLEEAALLAKTYHLSLDELMEQDESNAVVFYPSGLGQANLDFETYLQNLLGLLSMIQSKGVTECTFAAKDIPVFHLFQFPELAQFKMFFWRKTIFGDPGLAGSHFSVDAEDEKQERCLLLCRQIAEKYALIPTVEIWNEETAVSFLKQIAYYYDAGLLRNQAEAMRLTEQVEAYFQHLQTEAELGYKFLADNPPQHRIPNFTLYFNDLILIDNVIHITYETGSQTFLVYNSIEYLATEHPGFSLQIHNWLQTLTQKSDLISSVSERQRNQFFRKIFRRIEELKSKLD
jgi:hypothetical protein